MAEFAIVSGLFFFLLVAGVEILRLSYTKLSLQYVASKTLREAVIGPSPSACGTKHAAETRDFAKTLAANLGVGLNDGDIRICGENVRPSCPEDGSGNDTGGAQQNLEIKITSVVRVAFLGEFN